MPCFNSCHLKQNILTTQVHDEDFYTRGDTRGGPSPSATWGGSSHGSYEGSDKFWSVSGQRSPFWFPFRSLPPRPKRHSAPKKKLLVGDQGYCGTGSCEFFLFCWLGGGIIEGGCGGFLFACCHRSGQIGADKIAEKVSFFINQKNSLILNNKY